MTRKLTILTFILLISTALVFTACGDNSVNTTAPDIKSPNQTNSTPVTTAPTLTVTNPTTTAPETQPTTVPVEVPKLTIDQINWSVASGNIRGEQYVVLTIQNTSAFTITSIEIKFTEKDGISQTDKDKFYDDIQVSQGFDDEWMDAYVASREQLGQPMSMYGKTDIEIAPGSTADDIKCYYFGGWTSKNVIHHNLFIPNIAIYTYVENEVTYTIYYNFQNDTYDIETSSN